MNLLTNNIYVIDPPMGTGQNCSCGKHGQFVLGVGGHDIHLCEVCIAEVAKRIIDGLT